jgi:ABC-type branched-subunit amino acid transport system substrate-binding protein
LYQVGFCSSEAILSAPDLYPNFMRLNPSVSLEGALYADLMMSRPDLFLWGRVAVVSSSHIDSIAMVAAFKARISSKFSSVGHILAVSEIVMGSQTFEEVC